MYCKEQGEVGRTGGVLRVEWSMLSGTEVG